MRKRVVKAAASLLASGGRDAVTTRAVCAAAGTQPPTIYRLFGDMQKLLDAAARETLAAYVQLKAERPITHDPIADLRRGWDAHVAFGVANPAAFVHLYGDPRASNDLAALQDGYAHLQKIIVRIAEAGQLRVTGDHAARLIHSGATGITLTLIATPKEFRDDTLSRSMRDTLIAAIADEKGVVKEPEDKRASIRAIALRAVLQEQSAVLSAAEQILLVEWLDRLSR